MSNGRDVAREVSSGSVLSQTPYLIVLVAVLGFLAPRSTFPTVESQSSSTPSAESARRDGENTDLSTKDRLSQMLAELTGETSAPVAGNPWWNKAPTCNVSDLIGWLASWLLDEKERAEGPQFLIATMHDPVDSHLQTYFDADLAVIQRAIQKQEFILHRHWLPWQAWIHQSQNAKVQSTWGKRLYEREPGILLFRRDSPADKGSVAQVLVVLLVGETPTGGVHPEAFRNALDVATRRSRKIRIIGPSASGTCVSISHVLAAWHRERSAELRPGVDVQLISGSATSENALRKLIINETVHGSTLTSDIKTTILPDHVATDRMFRYLIQDRHIAAKKIALLREADTSYGRDALKSDGPNPLAIDDVLILPYPMEISTVRNEYEKVRALKFGPQEPSTLPRMNLDVPWLDPPDARDRLPQFSDSTPAVTERRMAIMLSTLARRDIRAIGLLGTDPKDLLYLGQQVRRFCPNVQLFAFESNVLFSHPDYVGHFKGTIVASTYPSFMNNQEWTRLSRPRTTTQYSSSISEGTFNATLAHLEQMYDRRNARSDVEQGTQCGDDRKIASLVEYSMPFIPESYGSPPLWLNIIGQNGVSPVRAIAPEKRACLLYKPIKPCSTATPPNQFLGLPPFTFGGMIINGLVVGVAIAFLLQNLQWAWTRNLRQRWAPGIWPWLSLRGTIPDLPSGADRPSSDDRCWLTYALVLFGGLTALQWFASIVIRKSARLPESVFDGSWPVVIAAHALAFAALAACLSAIFLILMRYYRLTSAVAGSRYRHWGAVVVIALIVAAVAAIAYSPWSGEDKIMAAIQVERWGDIFNGVTPLFPLVCMAMIPVLWAVAQLRRTYFAKIHHLGRPFPRKETAGLAERLTELDSTLTRRWWMPTEFRDLVLLLGIIWLGAGLYFRWISTADTPGFDSLLLIFGIVNLTLIYGMHVRFMATCGLLERFLRRLAQTALADSFTTVPPRLKAKSAGQIFAASPHPGDLNIVILQLEELVRSEPFDDNRLQAFCRHARLQFDKMDRRGRASKTSIEASMDSINRSLRASCRLVLKQLFPRPETAKVGASSPNEELPDSLKVDARKFVATQITTLLRQTFAQVQNLLIFLTLMILLLLSAVYSYPYQPQRYISLCVIGLVLWLVGTTVGMFIKLNRNEVLSNLSNTTPNRFTPDRALVRQLFVFGLIPLLSLLAFQFPEIGNVVFSWVEGLQKALR